MSRREAGLCAAVCLALAAVAGVLMFQGCTDPGPRAWLRWYGEPPTAETMARVARVLPLLPASPWDCVTTIAISDRPDCPAYAATCYWPDQRMIETTQAGLHHEIAHSAFECAHGDPDYLHADAVWREVDAIR